MGRKPRAIVEAASRAGLRRIINHGNPWSIPPAEQRVLDALVESGDHASMAVKLGVAPCTVRSHITSAKLRMGVRNQVRAAVLWALFREGTA